MGTTKIIGISVLSLMVASLIFIGTAQLTDTNAYYCQEKNTVMDCNRFAGNGTTRCYPNMFDTKGYKDCSSGWAKIINDTIPPVNITTINGTTLINSNRKIDYICKHEGCVGVK